MFYLELSVVRIERSDSLHYAYYQKIVFSISYQHTCPGYLKHASLFQNFNTSVWTLLYMFMEMILVCICLGIKHVQNVLNFCIFTL